MRFLYVFITYMHIWILVILGTLYALTVPSYILVAIVTAYFYQPVFYNLQLTSVNEVRLENTPIHGAPRNIVMNIFEFFYHAFRTCTSWTVYISWQKLYTYVCTF